MVVSYVRVLQINATILPKVAGMEAPAVDGTQGKVEGVVSTKGPWDRAKVPFFRDGFGIIRRYVLPTERTNEGTNHAS